MANKRVLIIHGWGGYPEEGWFPWLKRELAERGFTVFVLAMPDSDEPEINAWVGFLAEAVKTPDLNTFFVGHSVGCQTVLRYLEGLDDGIKVGGAVLVAPWMELDMTTIAEEGEDAIAIARPWMETPIDFGKVKTHADDFTAIFSDSDPFVPLAQTEFFRNQLDARIIIEKNKGHFSGSDGVRELPAVFDELMRLSK